MNTESGVSAVDVQQAICLGEEYGGRKWSSAERQEACQRYEELTGEKIGTSTEPQSFDPSVMIVAMCFIVLVAGIYIFYRRKRVKRAVKKKKRLS